MIIIHHVLSLLPQVLDLLSLLLSIMSIYHYVTTSGLSNVHKLTEINSSFHAKYLPSSHCLLTVGAFIANDSLQGASQRTIILSAFKFL